MADMAVQTPDYANLLIQGLAVPNTPNYVNPAYATPEQRKQLYAYANELMKPQPVKNWAQGLGEMVRSLMGGMAAHQADVEEQSAIRRAMGNTLLGQIDSPSAASAGTPGPGAASPIATPDSDGTFGRMIQAESGGHQMDNNGQPLTSSAGAVGIAQVMPSTGPEAAEAAGLPWDENRLKTDPEYNRALGEAYYKKQLAAFGSPDLAAAAYNAGPGAVSAAIQKARTNGGSYLSYLPQETQNYVQTVMRGAVHPSGQQVAQNGNGLPISADAINRMMVDPDIPPEVKRAAIEQLAPKTLTTATGQVIQSYQNQPTGHPIAELGVLREQNPGSVPSVVSGNPQNPRNAIAPPAVSGQTNVPLPGAPQPGASPANVFGPGSPLGNLAQQKAETDAAVQATQAKAKAAQERFQRTQEEGPQLLAASYPLRQLQGILEKNNGELPTGKDAEQVMDKISLANMVGTWLGHPLTDEESRLPAMELLKKYGTQIATTQAQALLGHPTNLGLETVEKMSPNVGLSQQANLHLIDNLLRLNQLAQKKAQFEHDYYLAHPGPNAYDNFTQDWLKQISGPNAIPLSKYGRHVTLRDGTKAVYVPSTDPSGFSLFREDDPAFAMSVMAPEKK